MKKGIKALFMFLFMILVLSGALAAEKKSKPEIKLIDNYVAIFDFEVTTGDKGISRPLADRVIYEFSTSDRYKVIDRGNMNKILKEQKFQMSGCVAQECRVEAGQLLGVGKIVSGSVGIVGKTYYLTLQLIDVRTGEILKSAEDECRCEIDELLGSTRRLAKKLLIEQIVSPPAIAAKPATIVESETEEIERAKAKAEAEAIAKAKETERIKAEQIAKAKAEEIARAKAEAEAIAKAKETERIKAEQIAKAKAEEIARAKAEAEADAAAKDKLEEIEKTKTEQGRIGLESKDAVIVPPSVSSTAKETARDGRFIAYNNGTVLDTNTNLMWAAKDNGSDINWANAKSYCENYRGGGYSGWRMPTQDELAGLYDTAKTYKSNCGYDVHLTELIRLTCTWVWASETRGSAAAYFYFDYGGRTWYPRSYAIDSRALPVRSEAKEIAKPSEPMIAAIARPAEPEQKITNSIGMTFVYIKPGTFMMGSQLYETGRNNDEIQHQVTLTKGFYMGETEVTVGQWRTFARDAGYRTEAETGGGAYTWAEGKWEKKEGTYWDNPGFTQSDNHPVTSVSWNDVQEYIKWLNRKEGSNRYRLPTEAEWEYAARAGTQTARFWGEDPDQACSYANVADQTAKRKWSSWPDHNCDDRYAETSPIRSYQPNGFGLYDMVGNVWEWCEDWKGDYPSGSVIDPTEPYSGSRRVFRGGGWGSMARNCRSALRDGDTPGYRRDRLGFRLSRTPLSEQVEQSVAIAPKLAIPDRPTEPKPVTTPITIVPPAAPAKETARDGRFIAYDNGTVLDTKTNLMWAARDNGYGINWANAKSYCENYRGGGYTDWRMPKQDELSGLYDSAIKGKNGYKLTPLIELTGCCPWASEMRGSEAAFFGFNGGGRYWGLQSGGGSVRALPVRSGK